MSSVANQEQQGPSKEQKLVEHVLQYAKNGDAQSVMETIDKFCWNSQWMMNVGDVKGLILDEAVKARNPKIAVEIGCYCGYSAVRIGRLLAPDAKFYSIEISPEWAANARKIIEHAGLADKCQVLVGDSGDVIKELASKHIVGPTVDLFFIDHHKGLYLRDIKLVEEAGLLKPGSVVVADNVIYPGAPDYLEYIRANSHFKSTFHKTVLEYTQDQEDGVEVSIFQ